MKFLVDVGVGKKVENFLKINGYDVLSVREIDACARDLQILKWAFDDQRMIITMDKDFGNLFSIPANSMREFLFCALKMLMGMQKSK